MPIQSLNLEQILALLGAAKAHKTSHYLAILIGFCHGLRASEVVAIVRDDIQDGHLDVRRLKGSERTIQPLFASEIPLLDERSAVFDFVAKLGPNQRLFPFTRQTFWNILQRHGRAAGLPVRLCHPHVLKHTIAMQSIHSAGIENVRKYLGHKSMASTGEYLKVSDADASRAVQGFGKGLIV